MTLRVAFLLLLATPACGGSSVPEPPPAEPAAPSHDHAAHGHEAPTAPATTEEAHEGHAPTAHADGGHGDHAGHDADAPLPQTYAGALADLAAQAVAARGLADSGELKGIHPLTERIEKICVALPGLAATLDDTARATVTTRALAIKKTAGKLHHAADEGKAEETIALLDTLDADIAGLPAGQ